MTLVLGSDVAPGSLPIDLISLVGERFSLFWSNENLGSHNKYFDITRQDPSQVIVTCDDDTIYDRHFVRDLWMAHKLFPEAIIPISGIEIGRDQRGKRLPRSEWNKLFECPDQPGPGQMVKGEGTLYPPYALETALRFFPRARAICTHSKSAIIGADDSFLTVVAEMEKRLFFPARPYPRWFGIGGKFCAETGQNAGSLGEWFTGSDAEQAIYDSLVDEFLDPEN